MTSPIPGIRVTLKLSKQWNGAFEGEISLTNTGSTALSHWSVSFSSRYALRSVSNFTLQQSQQADGSWLITLSPPKWGTSLAPGRAYRSYVQGILPPATRLASLSADAVLIGDASSGSITGTTSGSGTGTSGTGTGTGGTGTSIAGTGGSSSGTGGTSGGGSDPTAAGSGTTGGTSTGTGGSGTGTSGSSTGGTGGTGTGTLGTGLNSGNAGDALWGERFFAPYVDMGLYPVPDLDGLARRHGVGLFTLGFIQATSSGEAAWAGLSALSLTSSNSQALAIGNEIRQLRASGGDVMVSFGGAAGTSLAESAARAGRSASELAGRYSQVIDRLALNRVDFDIEGAALANTGANQLLASALKLVQQSHPDLEIWFTLPVLPQGLTAAGLAVVRQALQAGVKLDGINIMAMNYGDSAAPPQLRSMGQYAIDAAEASFRQLSELFASRGQGFGWNQLGITPMLGVNDVTSEFFTTADAQLLEDFARRQGLGMLSMWSIARDNPGPLGQLANTHSGTGAGAGSYAATWGDYGTDPLIDGGVMPQPEVAIGVAAGSTMISASASSAERFQLGWAWGRTLTIAGFDPSRDVLDLRAFWAEGHKAQVLASGDGSRVLLDFNAQQVLLPGVAPSALGGAALQIWQG